MKNPIHKEQVNAHDAAFMRYGVAPSPNLLQRPLYQLHFNIPNEHKVLQLSAVVQFNKKKKMRSLL